MQAAAEKAQADKGLAEKPATAPVSHEGGADESSQEAGEEEDLAPDDCVIDSDEQING